MEALSVQFQPATGTDAEWNEAYARMSDYLRAYGIHQRLRRTHLIMEILQIAAEKHAQNPAQSPTEVAMTEVRDRLHRWLGELLPDYAGREEVLEPVGRLAFHLSEGQKNWPQQFLSGGETPEELRQAMQKSIRQSGPEMDVSTMVPRGIDLGVLPEVAENTAETFQRLIFLRYLLLILLIAAAVMALVKVTA